MKTLGRISGIPVVFLFFLIVMVLVGLPSVSRSDSSTNVPICTADGDQEYPQITTDGSGGAIIVWTDNRNNDDWNIYAQHMSASGETLWADDGVLICAYDSSKFNLQIISDGSGGAFISWEDNRHGYEDIYAQHVDASGVIQWTAGGETVCSASYAQRDAKLVSDGAGGGIITWEDYRNNSHLNIYAQKLNSSGPLWTDNGVSVCGAAGNQSDPVIISDGSGGGIIAWMDERSGAKGVYAQRLNSSGAVVWTAFPNGVGVSTVGVKGEYPKIVSDGSGGAVITWFDYRNATDNNIYAQRLNASGVAQWTTNGETVCGAANGQAYPELVGDGSGGAIITWNDERNGGADIYAQRLNSSGTALWTTNGEVVCNNEPYWYPQIISDGASGVIITWYDDRGSSLDIYAQRLNTDGEAQWTDNGVMICTASNDQEEPKLVSDGSGGAIITWYDYRNSEYDIYAQRVFSDGSTSYPTATFTSGSQQVAEDAVTATITVQLSEEFVFDVTVPFTLSGSATEGAGQDYTITASPLVFTSGETAQDITVYINNDSEAENSETVIVTMGSLTNAESGETTVHMVTITDDDSPPTVTTTAVSDIFQTTATSGGNVTADGGNPVTARGICWSELENPTTGDTCTSDGNGAGSFISFLTGLMPSRTYHVRAYATNGNGTSYGNDVEFKTRMCMPPIYYILLNP